MDNLVNLLDLNTAERVELKNLPGVGGTLADRILAARPFTSYSDLLSVRGFRPALLDTLKPYITLSALPPEPGPTLEVVEPPLTSLVSAGEPAVHSQPASLLPAAEDISELPSEPPSTPPALEPAALLQVPEAAVLLEPAHAAPAVPLAGEAPLVEPAVPDPQPSLLAQPLADSQAEPAAAPPAPQSVLPAPQSQPGYLTYSQALVLVVVGSLSSFVLAVACVLAVLLVVNGGLRFARPSQVSLLSSQLAGLTSQADGLETSLAGIDQRVGAVDQRVGRLDLGMAGLDQRLQAVDQHVQGIDQRVGAAETRLKDLDALELQVTGLSQDLEGLQTGLEQLSADLKTFSQKIEAVSLQVDALLTRTNRFQTFFDGLQDLLDQSFGAQAP